MFSHQTITTNKDGNKDEQSWDSLSLSKTTHLARNQSLNPNWAPFEMIFVVFFRSFCPTLMFFWSPLLPVNSYVTAHRLRNAAFRPYEMGGKDGKDAHESLHPIGQLLVAWLQSCLCDKIVCINNIALYPLNVGLLSLTPYFGWRKISTFA